MMIGQESLSLQWAETAVSDLMWLSSLTMQELASLNYVVSSSFFNLTFSCVLFRATTEKGIITQQLLKLV